MENRQAGEVFIVDDDGEVCKSLAFMLSTSGIRSQCFADGAAFLEAVPRLTPGTILLDLRMPCIDGISVLHRLKELGVSWPVVVITAHGEVAAAVQAIKLGAVDFVEKPFSEELLLAALDAAEPALAACRRESTGP